MAVQVSLKSNKIDKSFTSRCLIISCSFLLRMRNVSDKSCRENQNTHFMFSNFFLKNKSCCLCDNVEKHCRTGQPT